MVHLLGGIIQVAVVGLSLVCCIPMVAYLAACLVTLWRRATGRPDEEKEALADAQRARVRTLLRELVERDSGGLAETYVGSTAGTGRLAGSAGRRTPALLPSEAKPEPALARDHRAATSRVAEAEAVSRSTVASAPSKPSPAAAPLFKSPRVGDPGVTVERACYGQYPLGHEDDGPFAPEPAPVLPAPSRRPPPPPPPPLKYTLFRLGALRFRLADNSLFDPPPPPPCRFKVPPLPADPALRFDWKKCLTPEPQLELPFMRWMPHELGWPFSERRRGEPLWDYFLRLFNEEGLEVLTGRMHFYGHLLDLEAEEMKIAAGVRAWEQARERGEPEQVDESWEIWIAAPSHLWPV